MLGHVELVVVILLLIQLAEDSSSDLSKISQSFNLQIPKSWGSLFPVLKPPDFFSNPLPHVRLQPLQNDDVEEDSNAPF